MTKREIKLVNDQFYQSYWNLEQKILENINIDDLNLYIHQRPQYRMYMKYFGLCILLGATDIYDIGCGHDLQVGYISNLKGISYTGIDQYNEKMIYIKMYDSKEEPGETKLVTAKSLSAKLRKNPSVGLEQYAEYFMQYNDKIRFVHKKYPFPIQARENNIALLIDWLQECTNEERMTISEAVSRDFERILLSDDAANADFWRNSLSDFTLYEINRARYWDDTEGKLKDGMTILFGTKNVEEISYLKEVGYNFHDERFFADEVDRTRYITNFLKNEK